jgi:hypothetical protein
VLFFSERFVQVGRGAWFALENSSAQRKLTLNEQGLGLCLFTGTQEPMKNMKNRSVKLTLKKVKPTAGLLM